MGSGDGKLQRHEISVGENNYIRVNSQYLKRKKDEKKYTIQRNNLHRDLCIVLLRLPRCGALF